MSVFFSIVIPLYNKRPFIESTLRSIQAQNDPSLEIIVVDDGSSDGGAALVEAFDDPRIQLVRQDNAGVSAARNTGIAIANGDYVCFLDADDWYFPGYLTTLRQLISAYPKAIAYGTAFQEVDADSLGNQVFADAKTGSRPFKLFGDFYAEWAAGERFFTGSICVRREALLALGDIFPVGESLGEDQDVWFRLAERGFIAFAPSPLVAYRRDVASSLTAGRPELFPLPVFQRLAMRVNSPEFPGHLRSSARCLLARQYVTIARNHLFLGHRLATLRWLLGGYFPARSRYWWTTLFLAVCCPSSLVLARESRRRAALLSK